MPSVAGYIVNAGGAGGLLQKVNSMTIQVTTTTTNATIQAGAQAAEKLRKLFDHEKFEIDIKNLLTGTMATQTVTTNQYTATLLRDTPYSWCVVSKSNTVTTTAKSEVWKFYNAGLGTVSHLPFPADALMPAFGQNVTATGGKINLSWTGSDPDSDIAGYDVYFGSTAAPPLSQSNVTSMSVNGVAVTSGITYYWKVITKDNQGNSSDSGTFQFKVN